MENATVSVLDYLISQINEINKLLAQTEDTVKDFQAVMERIYRRQQMIGAVTVLSELKTLIEQSEKPASSIITGV